MPYMIDTIGAHLIGKDIFLTFTLNLNSFKLCPFSVSSVSLLSSPRNHSGSVIDPSDDAYDVD
jgi:membrane-anchored glycerophosphoryl diester phosphodiesterase (GDPDase)